MRDLDRETLEHLYNVEGLSQSDIAERYGLSQPAVSKKMEKYGVESWVSKKWTGSDEEYLENNYRSSSKEQLKDRFENRTWNAIKLKAMALGVARSAEEYRKSEDVKKILRENAEELSKKVDFGKTREISYILGVIEGDGYRDKNGTFGLEVRSEKFADKFIRSLEKIGLNPGKGSRRNKITVWASSVELENWFEKNQDEERIEWLMEEGCSWSYLEGLYDSDGNLHPSGSPRICSYDRSQREKIHEILSRLGVTTSIQQNNVWISKKSSEKFFSNVDCVLEKRMP